MNCQHAGGLCELSDLSSEFAFPLPQQYINTNQAVGCSQNDLFPCICVCVEYGMWWGVRRHGGGGGSLTEPTESII